MKCLKHGPVGAGGCQLARVTQSTCQRVAKYTRVTSGGVKIRLCARCDADVGDVVGKREEILQ